MPRQKKWSIYLMLVVMLFSACLFVPSREDEARHGTAVSAEAKLMKPETVIFVDCKLPEEETETGLLRTQGIASAKEGSLQTLIHCFCAIVLAVTVLPCDIYGSVVARYVGYTVTLRYHIFYIHQLDGKKKTAFCNQMN